MAGRGKARTLKNYKFGIKVCTYSHHTYAFVVRYHHLADAGERRTRDRKEFKTQKEAEDFAKELVKQYSKTGAFFDEKLTVPERYAIRKYREAQPLISLEDWIQDGARKEFGKHSKLPVEKAVEEFIAARDKDNQAGGKISATYFRGLCRHVKAFGNRFGGRPMFSMTLEEIRKWNREELTCEAKGKNDYLASVKQLFNFCELDVLSKLDPLPKNDAPREFYTLDEVRAILNYNRPSQDKNESPVFAVIVLSLFCGVRQSEAVNHIEWEAINFTLSQSGTAQFLVSGGKTGSRHVEIPEVAKDWLKLIPKERRTGNIFKTRSVNQENREDNASSLIRQYIPPEVKPKKNAFRHSWCTYHVSCFHDFTKAAKLMGNTPDIIEKHYYKSILEKDASSYWQISPYSESEEMIRRVRRQRIDEQLRGWKEVEEQSKKDLAEEVRKRMDAGEDLEEFLDMVENPEKYFDLEEFGYDPKPPSVPYKSLEERIEEDELFREEILRKINKLGDGERYEEDGVRYEKSVFFPDKKMEKIQQKYKENPEKFRMDVEKSRKKALEELRKKLRDSKNIDDKNNKETASQ